MTSRTPQWPAIKSRFGSVASNAAHWIIGSSGASAAALFFYRRSAGYAHAEKSDPGRGRWRTTSSTAWCRHQVELRDQQYRRLTGALLLWASFCIISGAEREVLLDSHVSEEAAGQLGRRIFFTLLARYHVVVAPAAPACACRRLRHGALFFIPACRR